MRERMRERGAISTRTVRKQTTRTTIVFDKNVDVSTIMSRLAEHAMEIRRRSGQCEKGMRLAKLGTAKRT